MQLILVDNKALERVFLDIPFSIYANDPVWIPHLESDICKTFDAEKNKLLKEGQAKRWVLMDDHGKYIGRIAAFINPKTRNWNGIQVGGLGFFECIHSQEAANLLFDVATDWLKENGMQAVDGPINLGERDAFWGLLMDGFSEPMYRANYNPPYYAELFERYGFQLFFRQFTYYRDIWEPLSGLILQRAERVLNNPRITFQMAKKNRLKEFGEHFRTIYNEAWVKHQNVGAMTSERAQAIMKAIRPIMDERLLWFAFDGDRPIAFSLMLPDINTLLRKNKGKFGLFQKLKLLWDLRTGKAERIFGVIFGIVPDFQGQGMESALAVTLEREKAKAPTLPYQSLEMNWIGDFNPKMMKVAEMVGGKIFKEHRTFRLIFDGSIEFEREKEIL
jgi:hypothetical protein